MLVGVVAVSLLLNVRYNIFQMGLNGSRVIQIKNVE